MFSLRFAYHQDLNDRGCYPWSYHAEALLRLTARRHGDFSSTLPFRLDTGAVISALPARWLDEGPRLRRFVGALSAPMAFSTIAGVTECALVRAVPVQFAADPTQTYPIDFLVTDALDHRQYGLIALRDVVRHFSLELEGGISFRESGEPVELPNLMLIPRAHGVRVRYRCPQCGVEARGRPGLHLVCGDCNRRLVSPPPR